MGVLKNNKLIPFLLENMAKLIPYQRGRRTAVAAPAFDVGAAAAAVASGEPEDMLFNAPLLTSLVPQKATGSSTPTFTRATTAYVEDFEGLLKPVLSGEARFKGARRVGNLFSNTHTLTAGGGWTVTRATSVGGVDDPNGGTDAFTLTATSANGQIGRTVSIVGSLHTTSVYLRRRTGTGTVSVFTPAGIGVDITASLTSSWKRFTAGTGLASGTIFLVDVATSSDAVDVYFPQCENVTGQSNTSPSEPVSNGLLSAPYHGAGVDGVKYFHYQNGNTVASNVVTEANGAAISTSATLFGYQAEGSRTNLCLQSQTLDNASWTKNGCSISANAVSAPDGTTTMDKIVEDTANGIHECFQQFTTTANATYTVSATLKAGERTSVALLWSTAAEGSGCRVVVDLSNGTLSGGAAFGTGTYTDSTITPQANGTYRVTLTGKLDASSTTGFIDTKLRSAGSESYLGDGASGAYGWGFQLEAAALASSYIPTTTASVTRNADVLTYVSAGNVSGTQGTCYAEATVSSSGSTGEAKVLVSTHNGTEGTPLYFQNIANTPLSLYDGTAQRSLGNTSPPYLTPTKFSTAWGGTACSGAVSGTVTTGTFDGDMNISATIAIGKDVQSTGWLFGTIRNVRIYGRKLSDANLKGMTS